MDAPTGNPWGTPPLPPEAMTAALHSYNAVPAGASNVIVRTDVFRHIGGFDENLTHVPDWDLWLRLGRHGVAACVDQPLVGVPNARRERVVSNGRNARGTQAAGAPPWVDTDTLALSSAPGASLPENEPEPRGPDILREGASELPRWI